MNREPELELLEELQKEHVATHLSPRTLEETTMNAYHSESSLPVVGRRRLLPALALVALPALAVAAGTAGAIALVDGWDIWVDEIDADTNHVVFDNEDEPSHSFRLVVDPEDTGTVLDALDNGGMVLTAPWTEQELEDLASDDEDEPFEVLLPDGGTRSLVPETTEEGARIWREVTEEDPR